MNLLQALLLGVLEGTTEFLPVSSTGHLTVAEAMLGLPIDDPGVTAFTAVIQLGAIAAVLLYFRRDIVRLAAAWVRGLVHRPEALDPDYRLAWLIILGSAPVVVVGLLGRGLIAGPLRSLWVVALALIGWSVVMLVAERRGSQQRGEGELRVRDALVIGVMQCCALIPGVSRSGATISAGLLRGLDRSTATRLSFFLSIPALTAAGLYEGASSAGQISASVGWGPTLAATAVSFLVAYACIAWLLRFVAHHPITVFVYYRVAAGALLLGLLGTGVLAAT